MAGVVLLVLVSLLLVTKEDGAGGYGAQRRVPRAVDRVVTGAVLALVAGGVPEPIGGFAGGLVLVLCTRVPVRLALGK